MVHYDWYPTRESRRRRHRPGYGRESFGHAGRYAPMAHTPDRDEGGQEWPHRNHPPEERWGYGRPDWAAHTGAQPQEPGPEGPFVGRGPSNWRRTDRRIHEDVCDRLTDDPLVDPSDVEVRVEHGEVTFEGRVDGRFAKRRLDALADDVPGVRDVHNLVSIER